MWRITACVILLGCSAFIFCADEKVEKKPQPKPPCAKSLNTTEGRVRLNVAGFTGECVWSIKPLINGSNETATVSFFLHSLFLHENDTVTLFTNEADVGNDSLSIIEPLRAQNGSVTILTGEKEIFIKFIGDPKVPYVRNFDGMYHGQTCSFPLKSTIDSGIQLIHSPIAAKTLTKDIECKYTFDKDQHSRITASFLFKEFKMSSSAVSLSQTTVDGPYNKVVPIEFFPISEHQQVHIDVKMPLKTNDSYCLQIRPVDFLCQGHKTIDESGTVITLVSPKDTLNNGTILPECRWVIEHPKQKQVLGIQFVKLLFDSAIDIIAINDGPSELSTPLVQVTASSGNLTKYQLVRSTGPFMWVSYKPNTYASELSAIVQAHNQGGHFNGSGSIAMNPDATETVFLLEVPKDEIVLLEFDEKSDFPSPATLSVYDGFDKTNLLATLHGKVWYPVISKSSKMLLIASQFDKGSFKADFKGMPASCLHMSSFTDENYVLTGNCNKTCLWVVPPQDQPNSNLILNLQYLNMNKKDTIRIRKLDATKTVLGDVSTGVSHVPQMMVPAEIGALVEIGRAACDKENSDVVVVGHSSYLPACGSNLTLTPQANFQISSPLHPDTYPLYANCKWQLSTAKTNLVHLAFHSLKLAPNHCVKVIQNKTEQQFVGVDLPGDLFLMGDATVEFDSGNCTKAGGADSLVSSEGFVLNGTVSDCGGILSGKASGTFTVAANKTLCIWKVSVPETGHDASDVVNVISYSVSKNDQEGNYELDVYDGNSIRDSKIVNESKPDLPAWSRSDSLIFVYKKVDAAKPSASITVKYETIGCNSTMQCENKVCMHPDWRCNGVNDCGDFTDERNCNAVPIPPIVKLTGYSSTTFWVTITIMLAIGVALGFGVPVCYQKYRNGQYRRFGEISIIE